MHQIAPLKKLSGEHAPKPPSNGHGFAMRSMWLRDMQIPKSEKNSYCLPPPPNPGYALVNCDIFIIYIYYKYVCMFNCVFIFYMDNV